MVKAFRNCSDSRYKLVENELKVSVRVYYLKYIMTFEDLGAHIMTGKFFQ